MPTFQYAQFTGNTFNEFVGECDEIEAESLMDAVEFIIEFRMYGTQVRTDAFKATETIDFAQWYEDSEDIVIQRDKDFITATIAKTVFVCIEISEVELDDDFVIR